MEDKVLNNLWKGEIHFITIQYLGNWVQPCDQEKKYLLIGSRERH